MSKAAGIVVLYNPPSNILININSYIDQVEKLFIVDNSDKINNELVNKIKPLKKVEYINNNSNLGIAAALNIAANKAISEEFEYLLTMDQDSSAPEDLVDNLIKLFNKYPKAAIVTPFHLNKGFTLPSFKCIEEELPFTMTSGNLLSLSKFQVSGEFLEKLFIDFIDHEYCLRLRSNGFKIIRTNKFYINHNMGKLKKENIIGIDLFPSHHSSKRYYYRFRNRLYINKIYKKKFPDYVKDDKKRFFREIVEIILFEKNRVENLKMIYRGYKDYKKNNYPVI